MEILATRRNRVQLLDGCLLLAVFSQRQKNADPRGIKMIEYKRLEQTTDGFRDVELITDDANAEIAALEEMIEECEFDIRLPADPNSDGKFHVTIPGAAVGEFSECVYEIDDGQLDVLTDQWNQEILDAAESE
jgi:hypothetical protein